MLVLASRVVLALAFLWITPLFADDKGPVDVKQNLYFSTLSEINLTKNQSEGFKALINDYAKKRSLAIAWEMGRKRERLENRIKKSLRKIHKALALEMAELLSEDQYSKFPAFHRQLDKLLATRERQVIKRSFDGNIKSPDGRYH